MSGTLLRFGLWIILISLGLYVLRETYEDSPAQEYLSASMLQKGGLFGIGLVAAGAVVSILERLGSKVRRNRCMRCSKVIPKGSIYCPEHLRHVLNTEHDRTHVTRIRRT